MAESSSENNQGTFPGSPPLRSIVSDSGETWLTYRKNLTPRYLRAWMPIVFAYAMLAFGAWASIEIQARWSEMVSATTFPLLAVWFGYWLHPLMLFGHEAAHYHLAPNRRLNDWLANTFVLPLLGLDIKLYRRVHWQHHLHLGDPDDTEISYHNRPSIGFLLQAFTGILPIKTIISYYGSSQSDADDPKRDPYHRRRWLIATGRTALLHLTVLIGATITGHWPLAVAWVVGLVVFFPAFNMVRQILEHRSTDAPDPMDFRTTPHGAHNRMFPTGPFSSTFGGAGFNRHLLHHWDPGVSFTRFDDMERFLLDTPTAPTVEQARATYFAILRQLIRPK